MPRDDAPPALYALADARAQARRAHDWDTADRLKAEIEAAGWKVVDAASLYTLERAAPPDVDEGGVVRYGSSASVPSRLDDEPVGVATVVIVAPPADPAPLGRSMRSLADSAPDGTQVVVVANAPSAAVAEALEALDAADPGAPGVMTEVVWTSTSLGYAAALNAGIRRALAPVIVLVRAGVEPDGDLVGGIVAALDDERVAVAGPVGLVTDDLRQYREASPDVTDIDAIGGVAMGFRRADFVARGPLDEQFGVPAYLDVWWSLMLRDLGEEDDPGADPRLAVRIAGPTLAGAPEDAADAANDQATAKATKKAFYRYLKYFATRRDLLAGPGGDELRARLRGLA